MKEKLLTPREAAKELRIGLTRLYALLYTEKIRAEKRGTRWLIPASAIAERRQRVKALQELQSTGADRAA